MRLLAYLIVILLSAGLGTLDIYQAVNSFKEHRYGWFGWYIMMAVWMVALMINAVFSI